MRRMTLQGFFKKGIDMTTLETMWGVFLLVFLITVFPYIVIGFMEITQHLVENIVYGWKSLITMIRKGKK